MAEPTDCLLCGKKEMRTKRGHVYVNVSHLIDPTHRMPKAMIEVRVDDVEYSECHHCDETFYNAVQLKDHSSKAILNWQSMLDGGLEIKEFVSWRADKRKGKREDKNGES